MLHFQGGLKRLQEEAERLGLVLLTSNLTSVSSAAAQAAAGLYVQPIDHHTSRLARSTSSTAAATSSDAVGVGNYAGTPAGIAASKGHLSSKDAAAYADRVVDADAAARTVRVANLAQSRIAAASFAERQATLGWSGATMWLFTVSGTR